jgi:hypothetical protein
MQQGAPQGMPEGAVSEGAVPEGAPSPQP